MHVMLNCTQSRIREAKDLHNSSIFVASSTADRVELGQELGVVDVKFIGANTDYRTILLVQIPDLEDILTALDHIVVKLVPE
jgi:hypothetical protein